MKFTDAGRVVLAVRPEYNDYITIEVSDTGRGIAPEQQARIFESYRQAKGDPARSEQGSGLGLAITQRLVGAMQGEIHLKSEVGEGSCFNARVRLEVVDAPEQRAEVRTVEGVTRLGAVLVADDDAVNREVMQDYLAHCVERIDMAHNGQEVLDQVAHNSYDIILMDLRMPVMDGLTTTRALREIELRQGQPPVPILALSASQRRADQDAAHEAGCTSFLSKPLMREELLEALRHYTPLQPESAA